MKTHFSNLEKKSTLFAAGVILKKKHYSKAFPNGIFRRRFYFKHLFSRKAGNVSPTGKKRG